MLPNFTSLLGPCSPRQQPGARCGQHGGFRAGRSPLLKAPPQSPPSTSISDPESPGYPDSARVSIRVHLALPSSALNSFHTWGLHPAPAPVCCPESSILPQFPCPSTEGSIQPRSRCPGPSHSRSWPPSVPAPPAPYRERSRGKSRRLRRRRVARGWSPERLLPAPAPAPATEAAPGPALGIGPRPRAVPTGTPATKQPKKQL